MRLTEPFDVVLVTSATDPALDEVAMLAPGAVGDPDKKRTRAEAYVVTRDPAHLAFKPGAQPTLFRLRPLRAREANAIAGDLGHPDPDSLWSIVQTCLLSIKGPGADALSDSDWTVVDAMRGTKRVTDDGMEKFAALVGLAGVREIGDAVLRRAAISDAVAAPFASPRG